VLHVVRTKEFLLGFFEAVSHAPRLSVQFGSSGATTHQCVSMNAIARIDNGALIVRVDDVCDAVLDSRSRETLP